MHDFLLIESDLRNVETPSLSNSGNGSITPGMVERRPIVLVPYEIIPLRDCTLYKNCNNLQLTLNAPLIV